MGTNSPIHMPNTSFIHSKKASKLGFILLSPNLEAFYTIHFTVLQYF